MNNNRHYKPMQMNRYNTIQNRLTAYKVKDEAVPIIEFIGNGLDAGASKIEIKFTKDNKLVLYNNGKAMTSLQFDEYQEFAETSKIAGSGIGRFGEGAKLLLGAPYNVIIDTISTELADSNGKHAWQGCQFINGTASQREILVEEDSDYGLHQKTPWDKIPGEGVGTTQYISIPFEPLSWIHKNVVRIIRESFMGTLINDKVEITVNGRKVTNPHKLTALPVKEFTAKDSEGTHKFICHYYIADKVLDESAKLTNTAFITYGKRVKTIRDTNIEQSLNETYRGKVICIAECDALAKYVTLSKEDFAEGDNFVTTVHKKIRELFKEAVIENKLGKAAKKELPLAAVSGSIVKSCFDILKRLGYANILPDAVFRTTLKRSRTGETKASTEKRPPGVPALSGAGEGAKIDTELDPTKTIQPKTPGTNKGGSNYIAKELGSLNARKTRQRVTGIPNVAEQNCGVDKDPFYMNENDVLLINLDRDPFKSTKGKYKYMYNQYVKFAIFTYVIENADANNALNWTPAQYTKFWKDVLFDSWS